MSVLDRILLFLLAVASLCLGVALALIGANVFGPAYVFDVETYPTNIVAIVAGIIIVLIALRFLFYRISRSSPVSDFVALTGEHGHIRISYDTFRQLANRRGAQIKGAEGFDTRIRQGQEGIVVLARMQALPDVDIAAMSREVQSSIKDYVEKATGVTVEQVLVHVTELSNAPKQGKAWNGA